MEAHREIFQTKSNNFVELKQGEQKYDPYSQYDHIYNCLVHNMNYVTLCADSGCIIDESMWGFIGYSGKSGGQVTSQCIGWTGGNAVLH